MEKEIINLLKVFEILDFIIIESGNEKIILNKVKGGDSDE